MSNLVQLGPQYFPNVNVGTPVGAGSLYIGNPDTDPTIIGNQKTVNSLQEDGSFVVMSQPIDLSAGGIPLYSGSPVTLYTSGDYSMAVLDINGAQVYYVPSTPGVPIVPGNYYYPDAAETDQGIAGGGSTVKTYVDAIGSDRATLYFRHDSGNATTVYTFDTSEVTPENIKLILEEGAIFAISSGITLTIYSPNNIDAGAYQIKSGSGILAWTIGGDVSSDWAGAGANDGVTDETSYIDELTDSLNIVKGGVINFGAKIYVGNFTIKSFVTFRGPVKSIMYGSGSGVNGVNNPNITRLLAKATGAVIDTPVGIQYNAVIENLHVEGLGSAIAGKGIHYRNVRRSAVKNVSFDNFADEAFLVSDGNTCRYEKIIAINSLLDRTRAARAGVIDITGTDHYISYIEANTSQSADLTDVSDANLYLAAIVIRGTQNFIEHCVGEMADLGFWISNSIGQGDANRFIGCRADLNYGHGWEIASGSGRNQLIGCQAYRNSVAADNTYDGFRVIGTSQTTILIGCESACLDNEPRQRYAYYDEASSDLGDDADGLTRSIRFRNVYVGCKGALYGTAEFKGVNFKGSSFNITNNVWIDLDDDETTFNVDGGTLFRETYANPTTVTDFVNHIPGQVVKILALSGNVTLEHSAFLRTNTEQDKVLVLNRIYTFTDVNGVWYELTNNGFSTDVTVAGAGTDGTISSRSANPLSEADGFVKLRNSAGVFVYVPYWLDITP